MTTRVVTAAERRARLGLRHLLASRVDDPVAATRAMVGLHSSDPATVFLSARARTTGMIPSHLEDALYETRSIVRILGMRRTMWVVPTGFASVVNSSSTAALVAPQRVRTAEMIESNGIAKDGEAWVARISAAVLEALEARGQATARELTEDVPDLAHKIVFYKKDGSLLGEVGVSTRILFLLATDRRIVRTKPLGTWLSSQYRWSTVEHWLGSPLPDLDRDEAQAQLLAAWLGAFGPATETDMKWWTGWPVGQVRRALARIDAVEVSLEEGLGYLAGDDLDPVEDPGPWVGMLPSLDPTTMGWRQRGWYLGEHASQLFDRNGNAGPTVWADGRVVGGWAQRKDGEIVHELFEDVGSNTRAAIAAEAETLQAWLGEVRVTPRFRSPHDKRLSDA